MSGRDAAVAAAAAAFDDGRYAAALAELVTYRTESRDAGRPEELARYLATALTPRLEALGFTCTLHPNPSGHPGGLLVARRHEGDGLATVLSYAHGDVVQGDDARWSEGLSPWRLTARDERWYGRGSADNKGQHLVNLVALEAVLATRGRLGFNAVWLIEMAEEAGSPGLGAFCEQHRGELTADLFIASDGPRVAAEQPTLFMGSRGVMNFDLVCALRAGGHHSGNWGGLLTNPAIVLAHALAAIVSRFGQIRVTGWRPQAIPTDIAHAVRDLAVGTGADMPEIDPAWGEPALMPGEKLYAWPSFEVLAFTCGDPERPTNAVPPRAEARCHLRFVPPLKPHQIVPMLRAHLDERGFEEVAIVPHEAMPATRLSPEHPLVRWAAGSLTRTTGKPVALLPNLGGSLPNAVFAETLGLPTLWVPHSYAGCRQHAEDEHVLPGLMREALELMAGLWWDLGEGPPPGLPDRSDGARD